MTKYNEQKFSITSHYVIVIILGTFATFQEELSTVEYTGMHSLEFLYTKRYIHRDGALNNIKLQYRIL